MKDYGGFEHNLQSLRIGACPKNRDRATRIERGACR